MLVHHGRLSPEVAVSSLRIVEELDVIEHVLARLSPISVDAPLDPFRLQSVKEALRDRIVVVVSSTTHTLLYLLAPQRLSKFQTRIMRALITMEH